MRMIFSLGVITAIVYLAMIENPRLAEWFKQYQSGDATTELQQQIQTAVVERSDKAIEQLRSQMVGLHQQQQKILARLDQGSAAREQAQPDHRKQVDEPPEDFSDDALDAQIYDFTKIAATDADENNYMSSQDRRRELMLLAQRMELRSLGIDE